MSNNSKCYPMGVIYKKQGSADEWKRTNSGEINITKLNESKVNDSIQLNGLDADLNDYSLYRINGSDGLWWGTPTSNVNIAQPITAQPITAQPITAQPITAQPITAQPITFINTNAGPGDVIGVDSNAHITRITGCTWSTVNVLNNVSLAILWDSTIRINAYVHNSKLYINAHDISTDLIKNHLINRPIHADQIVRLIKLISNEYLIAYKTNNGVTLTKFTITKHAIKTTSTINYSCDVDTFNVVYEMSGVLDILTLVIYRNDASNLDVTLFNCYPILTIGYNKLNVSSEPIIGMEKALNLLLLPGQIIICGYASSKMFILLPANAVDSFNVGDTIANNNLVNCIDMIYDASNAVILSIDTTFTESIFIQVFDIIGTELTLIMRKQLSACDVNPIGIDYDHDNDTYMVFYSDDHSLYANIFKHDGEALQLGLIYEIPINHIPDDQRGTKFVWRINNASFIELNNQIISFKLSGVNPANYIGMVDTADNNTCTIVLKGQLFTAVSTLNDLPNAFIGKKIYCKCNKYIKYPNNLTLYDKGTVFIGTVIDKRRIIVGL